MLGIMLVAALDTFERLGHTGRVDEGNIGLTLTHLKLRGRAYESLLWMGLGLLDSAEPVFVPVIWLRGWVLLLSVLLVKVCIFK